MQLQERLTRQIAQAVTDAVEPAGVGVVIEAKLVFLNYSILIL